MVLHTFPLLCLTFSGFLYLNLVMIFCLETLQCFSVMVASVLAIFFLLYYSCDKVDLFGCFE